MEVLLRVFATSLTAASRLLLVVVADMMAVGVDDGGGD
jgi:hypothetical protein